MSVEKSIKTKQQIYYARILSDSFEVCDLVVRSVYPTYFVAIDKHDKRAFLFNYDDIGRAVFLNRADALEKVMIAESRYKK